jgi:hypothetical protein
MLIDNEELRVRITKAMELWGDGNYASYNPFEEVLCIIKELELPTGNCTECAGTGKVDCANCDGTGAIRE